MYGYAYPIRTISASGVYSAQAKLREKLRIKALIEPTMVPVYISPPLGRFRGYISLLKGGCYSPCSCRQRENPQDCQGLRRDSLSGNYFDSIAKDVCYAAICYCDASPLAGDCLAYCETDDASRSGSFPSRGCFFSGVLVYATISSLQ